MKGSRVLAKPEIDALMAVLEPRDKLLILTGLTYGLRISEALRLKFGDFKGDYFVVDRRLSLKNSDVVTFPVPEPYRKLLREVRKGYEQMGVRVTNDTGLFLSYQKKPMSRIAAHNAIKEACAKAGITGKVSTHSFRKCFVTKVYEMVGKDLIRARHFSRHKSLTNLQYYIETCENTDLINDFAWT